MDNWLGENCKGDQRRPIYGGYTFEGSQKRRLQTAALAQFRSQVRKHHRLHAAEKEFSGQLAEHHCPMIVGNHFEWQEMSKNQIRNRIVELTQERIRAVI